MWKTRHIQLEMKQLSGIYYPLIRNRNRPGELDFLLPPSTLYTIYLRLPTSHYFLYLKMKFSCIFASFMLVGAGLAASQVRTDLRQARRFGNMGSHEQFDKSSARRSGIDSRQFEDPKGLDRNSAFSSSASHAPTDLPMEHEPGTKPKETQQANQN